MKKQPKKPIKSARKPRAKKPKPVPANPVVVWEQEPEKDWLDHAIDKVAGWLTWRR